MRTRAWLGLLGALGLVGCDSRNRQSEVQAPGSDAGLPAARQAARPPTSTRWSVFGSGFQLAHPLARYAVNVDAQGAHLSGRNGQWSLDLALCRIGRAGTMQALTGASPTLSHGRIERDRGWGIREWLSEDPRGIEHGVDLAERPRGVGDLMLEVDTVGLSPSLDRSRGDVVLRDARSRPTLRYSELTAVDADGVRLPASLGVEHDHVVIRIDDAAAHYPIAIDPIVLGKPESELVASDAAMQDLFGQSVSLAGSTLVTGAPGKNASRGSAYVFGLSGSSWNQTAGG